ncbi:10891_t:CDS:10 [Ambispora leptoticha]|uniref:Anaphase-promoting complex subunit 2 n=1 Tax=Ambispora leptoticha TaxID=144679 RepID=A0A9N8WH70_9GLOM|nr:10891_t:CDS:10 [Ambispora leptoticha]
MNEMGDYTFANSSFNVDFGKNWETAIRTLNEDAPALQGLRQKTKAYAVVKSWMDPVRFSEINLDVPQEVSDSMNLIRDTPLAQRLIEWYLDAVCDDFSVRFKNKLQEWRYSTETMLLYQLRYHTMLYSSLQDKSQLYSTVPSSFKEMTKIVYRTNYKKFEKLRKQDPNLLETFLPISTKHNGLSENELFAWKSNDDLNSIYLAQENRAESKNDNPIDNVALEEIAPIAIDKPMLEDDGAEGEEEGEEDEELSDIDAEEEEPSISTIGQLRTFSNLCSELDSLDLLYRTKDILEEMLCEQIELRIEKTCKKNYYKPQLRRSTRWLYSSLYRWLQIVMPPESLAFSDTSNEKMVMWSHRLNYHFCMVFCDLRIKELFELIVDFPESKPAIDDLLLCMKKLEQDHRHRLVQSLHTSFKKRLLIPGATTTDILKTYISTIKCLRILDPPGVLLEKVTSSIRSYLRSRNDTVRCLVSCWMDDKNPNSELIEELGRATIPVSEDEEENSEFDNDNWMNWVPDPIDAGPNYKSTIHRSADITNILINMFDNTDEIIEEIQKQMAPRLLSITDYDTTKEVAKLELFKLRFQEAKMAHTEVMIKDIADSKRMDNLVHTSGYLAPRMFNGNGNDDNQEGEAPLHAHIISKLFWPPPKHEELLPPEPIQDMIYKFEGTYTMHKQRRKLEWFPNLGTVDLEIELEDRTLEFRVSPIYATIIYHFQMQEVWWLKALAKEMHMEPAKLRKKMPFWVDHGVLKMIETDKWKLLEKSEGSSAGAFISYDEPTIAIQTVEPERLDELRVFWTFIHTMLTNLGALSLDRIHNNLTRVVQPVQYTATADELKEYLGLCIAEGKIEQIGSLYQLKDP